MSTGNLLAVVLLFLFRAPFDNAKRGNTNRSYALAALFV
jgi:hypothetical protein